MPAENDPADPNALTQSLQLTCSLTPSSTVPSTRLVIIWLKRCLARSPIDPALESTPVTTGGADDPCPSPPSQSPPHSFIVCSLCADAGDGCICMLGGAAKSRRRAAGGGERPGRVVGLLDRDLAGRRGDDRGIARLRQL